MSNASSTVEIVALNVEIDRLRQKEYFLEKKIRELEREINDYAVRETELLAEIEKLSKSHDEHNTGFSSAGFSNSFIPSNKEDFINPKLPTDTPQDKPLTEGLEAVWGDLVYGYTDKIFVEADTPDILFYRDEKLKCYTSTTGKTRLRFPITEETLAQHNIISWRPTSSEEIQEIVLNYKL
jgi:hypothetical protein